MFLLQATPEKLYNFLRLHGLDEVHKVNGTDFNSSGNNSNEWSQVSYDTHNGNEESYTSFASQATYSELLEENKALSRRVEELEKWKKQESDSHDKLMTLVGTLTDRLNNFNLMRKSSTIDAVGAERFNSVEAVSRNQSPQNPQGNLWFSYSYNNFVTNTNICN